jgi:HPt (histidine-containing phosphotransfer) domain-containing protein
MDDDSMPDSNTGTRRQSLWSRIRSIITRLTAVPADDSTAGSLPGQSTAADPPEILPGATLSDQFSSRLLAELLLELPRHREAFTSAWLDGDRKRLGDCAHQLAGAVTYCDLPELDSAIADLREKIRDGDELALQRAYNRASREIDELLEKSGLR